MKEIFKDIPNYEGLYEVSNFGNVKSLRFNKERILKGCLSSTGYLTVTLWENGVQKSHQIHVLVAIAFLDHTPCGMELVVNHMDLNKLNNKLDNLEVITQRENSNRKHLNSTSKYVGVSWHKALNKWKSQIAIKGKRIYLGLFVNEYDAHLEYQKELEILKKS